MVTNSNQSGKVQQWFFTSLLVVIILVLLGLLGYSNWQLFQRRREAKTELNQLDRKIKALEEQKATVRASINEETDYVVEEIAREQMNLKKPGEKVIDIKKPPEQEEQEEEKKGWRKWWGNTRNFLGKGWEKVQFWK